MGELEFIICREINGKPKSCHIEDCTNCSHKLQLLGNAVSAVLDKLKGMGDEEIEKLIQVETCGECSRAKECLKGNPYKPDGYSAADCYSKLWKNITLFHKILSIYQASHLAELEAVKMKAVEKEQIRLGKLMGEHLTRELSGLIDWCKALSQEGKE